MHMFDEKEKLCYTPQDIIDYFYNVRKEVYVARKIHNNDLEREVSKPVIKQNTSWKTLVVMLILEEKEDVVTALLIERG